MCACQSTAHRLAMDAGFRVCTAPNRALTQGRADVRLICTVRYVGSEWVVRHIVETYNASVLN